MLGLHCHNRLENSALPDSTLGLAQDLHSGWGRGLPLLAHSGRGGHRTVNSTPCCLHSRRTWGKRMRERSRDMGQANEGEEEGREGGKGRRTDGSQGDARCPGRKGARATLSSQHHSRQLHNEAPLLSSGYARAEKWPMKRFFHASANLEIISRLNVKESLN